MYLKHVTVSEKSGTLPVRLASSDTKPVSISWILSMSMKSRDLA